MRFLIRSLSAPLLSLFFLMLGSGLFNTFVSVKLEMEGVSPEMIGIVTSSLYVGILIGSLKIDRWISYVGHIRSFTVLAVLLSVMVLVQGFWMNPWYWSFLRVIGGICSAGVIIIIESWLLMQSAAHMRGAALSVYLAVLYGSLTLGQLLLNLSDPTSLLPYFITTLFVIFSILPISIQKIQEPVIEKDSVRLNLFQLFRISPVGFLGGVVSGMILSVVYGLVPVYAKEIGMSLSEVGSFMAVIIFGGFSLQWPIGKLADKKDRAKIIRLTSFLAALLSLSFGWIEHLYLLYLAGFFFGGLGFTLYPLSMAYTCEGVEQNQIVAVTGGFVLSYGMGAILGPILAPLAMNFLGAAGIFYFLGMMSLSLGTYSLLIKTKVKQSY